MTILQFVRDECANYKYGKCLFGACSVAAGERCCVSHTVLMGGDPHAGDKPYFEVCVLPLAKTMPKYADAARQYTDQANIRSTKVAELNFCGCGQPMEKRARFCEKCARNRRLESYRKQKAHGLQLSEKTPL